MCACVCSAVQKGRWIHCKERLLTFVYVYGRGGVGVGVRNAF